MPPWLADLTGLSLTHWQQLGLAFLLGSFAVATWSDLKYLAAQREFVEVWAFFALVVLAYDAVRAANGHAPAWLVTLKWALIAALSLASWRRTGWLFRLAAGDVAALAAAASLLPPGLVLALYVFAKLLSLPLGPVLARGRPHYPFMPVALLATASVQILGALVRAA
jgi:hypothetical protein